MLLQSIFIAKRRKLLISLILLTILSLLVIVGLGANSSSFDIKYRHFSSLEEVHCPFTECPGKNCLCTIGSNGLLYLDETIGDIE